MLFRANDKIMFAPYTVVGDAFRADTPQIWSPTSIVASAPGQLSFALHPDGKRVATAVAQAQANGVQDHVVFVSNFGDGLRTIAPGTK